MKTETKKKFIVLATILVIGTIMTAAVAKLAGNNTVLKHFILVASTALAGHVIDTPQRRFNVAQRNENLDRAYSSSSTHLHPILGIGVFYFLMKCA